MYIARGVASVSTRPRIRAGVSRIVSFVTRRNHRWVALLLMLTLMGGSCYSTEGSQFGLSRTVQGEVFLWFRECVSSPSYVSLYTAQDLRDGDSTNHPLWSIRDRGRKDLFPVTLRIGDAPSGYALHVPLGQALPEDELLEIHLGSGEVWFEKFDFRLSTLSDERILRFDRTMVTPAEFRSANCES